MSLVRRRMSFRVLDFGCCRRDPPSPALTLAGTPDLVKNSLVTLLTPLVLTPFATGADPVPLGPEFVATSVTANVQKQPRVACDDDGNFVYVYSKWNVYARRFDRDGTPLGNDFLVNQTNNGGEQDETWVAVDPTGGDYMIAWSDRNGGDSFEMGIGGRFYRANGTPYGGEFFINTHTQFSQFDPRIAFTRTGRVIVAWTDAGADGSAGAFGRIFLPDGTPLTGEILLNQPSTFTQIQPDVASDGAGNFVATYVDASGKYGEPRQILARRFDANGVPLGNEFLVNTVSAGMQRYPSVACGAAGDFVIAWHDESGNDGSGFGVFARAFHPNGTPKGPQFTLSNTTVGDQKIPLVECDYVGNFIASWEDWSSGDSDAKARRFDKDAVPLGSEFTLHAPGKPGHQMWQTVALSQSGQRIIASWFDTNSDAYARIFDVPTFTPDVTPTLGQTTTFTFDIPGVGGQPYIFLPSLSTGGIPVNDGRTLGLGFDPLLLFAVQFPTSSLFNGLAGTLDATGGGSAQFIVPNDAAALGVAVSFALVTYVGTPHDLRYLGDSRTYVLQ